MAYDKSFTRVGLGIDAGSAPTPVHRLTSPTRVQLHAFTRAFNGGANRRYTCCGSLYPALQVLQLQIIQSYKLSRLQVIQRGKAAAKSNNLARESTGIGARSERYYHRRGAIRCGDGAAGALITNAR